jgi:hypothetical protein
MTTARVGRRGLRWKVPLWAITLAVMSGIVAVAAPATSGAVTYAPRAGGELDCNGNSPIQHPIKSTMACTDIRGFAGVHNAHNQDGRFYDNGVYIGHDEPDMTFLSQAPGSGNNVTWDETLGTDPKGAPTIKTPGVDVSHWYQLSIAPWFSMDMCDGNSYPQLPCTPNSDTNAPKGRYPGAGGAFMEMQFYPPGFAPFSDAISCDNTHWCAALNIDSLECTSGFAQCNSNCTEPVNFAFIQTDGVPAGPPSPQLADLATFTGNRKTLLMNPGDHVRVHMLDTAASGGGKAFEVVINDLTTHQSGFMQASAANGFAHTSIVDCSGTPFNYEPAYSSAAKGNITPWTALQTNISTQFEIGHFEGCTTLTKPAVLQVAPGVTDTYWNTCHGPYENAAPGGDGNGQPEVSDANCFPAGDTHGAQHSAPDTVTGCIDNHFQNGDLDFDGSPYWQEWPTGSAATATYPASFVQGLPQTNGAQYPSMFFQTDVALSESSCLPNGHGCGVPPPNAPGQFYPYWSRVAGAGTCVIEFGNVKFGAGVNAFGGDHQYGTNQIARVGYPEFEGPVQHSACQ